MLKFDRIVLVVLVLAVGALVLVPHSCSVSGDAYGEVDGRYVYVYDVGGISVDCSHY